METIITKTLEESIRIKESFIKQNCSHLIRIAFIIADAFQKGMKLMICGNGGSAADAQHLAAEFVNRFEFERLPLPALALTTDSSVITSISNDYTFEDIFSKQLVALGVKGDVLLAISTSGRSKNILSAIDTARKKGIYTIGLTGGNGGDMVSLADMSLIVESNQTPRIQEAHILAGHILCQLVEYILFRQPGGE